MSSFPRSLYASLFVAVLLLQASSWVRGLEQRLCGLVVLPLRAYAMLQSPVHAAESAEADPAAKRLAAALDRAACVLPATMPGHGLDPLPCRVVALEQGSRQGKSLLLLDRTRSELRGCSPFVTHGEQLVGFLAAGGDECLPATVELLDHVPEQGSPRRLVCAIELPALGGGAAPEMLRCLVEPAPRALGPGLLRCAVVDDPYRAARIATGGGLVRTAASTEAQAPWPGLLVGELRVRGYEQAGLVVPIGLFARPPVPARALGVVAAWRRPGDGGAETGPLQGIRACLRHRVRVLALCVPPPARERWFLAAEGALRLPRGAAVLQQGALAGTVLGSGSGYAIAVPFGEGGEWTLVWVPRDPTRPPVELVARAVGRADGEALLVLPEDARVQPEDGMLVTGPNGLDCPSGIPVGEVAGFDRAQRTLRVRLLAGGPDLEQAIALARPRAEP